MTESSEILDFCCNDTGLSLAREAGHRSAQVPLSLIEDLLLTFDPSVSADENCWSVEIHLL